MNIIMENKIMMDGDMDLVHEEVEGQYREKGDFTYLIYTNAEDEKVILKCNQDELTVTRFSQPQSIMKFEKNNFAAAQIPSPVGLQRLVTKTTHFDLNKEDRTLILHYQLLPHPDAEQALADYQMRLTWS